MRDKQPWIDYCLTLPGAYEDYPFDDPDWTILRRQGNRELGIDNPIRNAQSDDGNQRGKHQCDHQRTNSNRSRRGGRQGDGLGGAL